LRLGEEPDIFVRVAMESDLVACVADLGELLGKGLDAVGGREPGCFDAVLVEEL